MELLIRVYITLIINIDEEGPVNIIILPLNKVIKTGTREKEIWMAESMKQCIENQKQLLERFSIAEIIPDFKHMG